MRIIDVYLDYVLFITIITLIFGIIGTSIGNLILSYRRRKNS